MTSKALLYSEVGLLKSVWAMGALLLTVRRWGLAGGGHGPRDLSPLPHDLHDISSFLLTKPFHRTLSVQEPAKD